MNAETGLILVRFAPRGPRLADVHQVGHDIPYALPDGWIGEVHPRGNCYYFHPEREVCAVADPRNPENVHRILNAAQTIRDRILQLHADNQIHVVIESTEDELQDGLVKYYVVDYTLQRTFWVDGINDAQLQLPGPVGQPRNNPYVLMTFWWHVERYPSPSPIDRREERRLVDTLNAAQLGDVEELVPFLPEQRREILRILKMDQGRPLDAYSKASLGQLWGQIYQHQHQMNHAANIDRNRPRRRNPVAEVELQQLPGHDPPFSFIDAIRRAMPSVPVAVAVAYTFLLWKVSNAVWGGLPFAAHLLMIFSLCMTVPLVILFSGTPQVDIQILAIPLPPMQAWCLANLAIFDISIYSELFCHISRCLVAPEPQVLTQDLPEIVLALTLPIAMIILPVTIRSGFRFLQTGLQ